MTSGQLERAACNGRRLLAPQVDGLANFPKPCVAGSNPAGGTKPETQSSSELPIRGAARGARLELWVTRVEADARIAISTKIAQ